MSRKRPISTTIAAKAILSDPPSPLEYVKAYFEVYGHRVAANRGADLESRRDKFSDIETRLYYDYDESVRNRRKVRQAAEDAKAKKEAREPKLIMMSSFPARSMEQAFQIYVKEAADQDFQRIKESLAYDPSPTGKEELDKLLKGIIEEPTDLDKSAFLHTIWQVKRKLWSKPSSWELWVNFLGKQGGGKTVFLRKLGEPLESLYQEGKVNEVAGDSRFLYTLQHVYLIAFEELEKASRVEMESIKSVMSKDKLVWRKLGKNSSDSGFNNATFISSSNKSFIDVFYDPTGMRRFYEIRVKDRLDRDAVNSIDFRKIWRAVDEHADTAPIIGSLESLLKYQEENLREKTPFEMFLEDSGHRPAPAGLDKYKVKARTLYTQYKSYCEDCGYSYPLTEVKFGRQLRSAGFKKTPRRTDGYFYFVETLKEANLEPTVVVRLNERTAANDQH